MLAVAMPRRARPGVAPRIPLLALPALLATLPWWPVPLPAIALIWTGPLAWVPIALALAAALGRADWRRARACASNRRLARGRVARRR